ncbi:H(+)/Cl(-) exchange transporter ClcA [Anaeroselena agilis]|uniref:H(+)/Cl(-) exchange transporter ClcA n=1 Tax=Anaeroselena agilis TaxID=3063788 RepID=A0ABU3NSE9_9FIRM|nr:H(+)/Cl(-) exchange transporter ClcA [Selenomonadales bacterium 4137-cl]
MDTHQKSKVYHSLVHWHNFRLKVFLEGIVIGIIAGIITVLFRYSIEQGEQLRSLVYAQIENNLLLLLPWLGALLVIALLLGLIIRFEPMTGGSGIPQVKGVLLGLLKTNWKSVLAGKFLGGVLAIGAGLSLGREGPSIQLGAAVGQGLSRMIGRTKMEERFLMTSGASAGLAAAFNAPLAGVVFALEELHKNFSPAVLMSAMAASITSALVTQLFFGDSPVFTITDLPVFPFRYYGDLIILGVLVGFLGIAFNKMLIKTLNLYNRQNRIPRIALAAIPLLIGGIAGTVLPEILGGGNNLVGPIVSGNYGLSMLLILLAAKFAFTMISYGSGVPGGIFLPMLVIGALAGGAFSNVAVHFLAVDPHYTTNFVILAMAALFTAVVKAPITGSILITEMTGSFSHLISLITISMTAYIVAELAKSAPVYEELLDRILVKTKALLHSDKSRTIVDFVVCVGSKLDGKRVKNVEWPSQCLLISIKRGDKEIVPQGDTQILAGDFVYLLTSTANAEHVRQLAQECLV